MYHLRLIKCDVKGNMSMFYSTRKKVVQISCKKSKMRLVHPEKNKKIIAM